MADFATDEWIRTTGERVADAAIDATIDLVLEQHVVDTDVRWHVVASEGRVRIVAGAHPEPTLRLSADAAIATAVHQGTLSAQRAFLDGDLRIGGDINALVEQRAALSAINALLAPAD